MSAWHPIATAPRDWLLLVKADTGSGGPYSGFFDLAFFNGVYWHDQEMRSLKFKPASWKFVDEREPPNWQPLHHQAVTAMTTWQPIATAPRDGSDILVATKKGSIRCVQWNDAFDDWMLTGTDNAYIAQRFLAAWQPLPAPPAADEVQP